MGKNQAYKAMQRARIGSSSAGPKESEDGMADGSFHSPEWHAARLASLRTSHTITWEEFKKKRKEDELKKGEMEADKDRMMREYRAQLDAERAKKLAQGRNYSKTKSRSKKDKKDKDTKKRSKRKRKHRRSSGSSSSSSSESSSSSSEYSSSSEESEDEGRESKRSRSKSSRSKSSRSKKEKEKRKHNKEEGGGPVRLSKFFGNVKD